MAGRVLVITLLVMPGLGKATPIRQSRVMISATWSSVKADLGEHLPWPPHDPTPVVRGAIPLR